LDELDFGWVTHMAISSHKTRYKVNKNPHPSCVYLVGAKLQRSYGAAAGLRAGPAAPQSGGDV